MRIPRHAPQPLLLQSPAPARTAPRTQRRARRQQPQRPFTLPVLEDSDSIQLALTKVMRLLAAGELDRKTASLMLYALQIATTNLHYDELDKPS